MDDFVCNKLKEWGLSECIDTFKDQKIDEERFYCLNDQDVNRLIPRPGAQAIFEKRLKLLKGEQNTTQERNYVSVQEHEEEAELPQVLPLASVKGKTKLDLHGESSKQESPAKQQLTEEVMLSEVKKIMESVQTKLENQKLDNPKLNAFLKINIKDLMTDKRELVGVFGKSGAGKSSLINAIIGEKDLLPTGSISACTKVIIKVKANMRNSKYYELEIEFITIEEWREELRSLGKGGGGCRDWRDRRNDDGDSVAVRVGEDDDDDDLSYYLNEKLSALYGEEYKNKTSEELMDKKYFKEISEFLDSSRKTFRCQSAKQLSEELVKYTRSESEEGEGKEVKRLYWPLVKCVTVRVPENEFLQNVTLVDLPENGDCNKSRDQIWKETVGKCSTVWIVTDINRAESEPEAWEILENASSHIGNGGECQQIHFICTKSDQIGDVDDQSAAAHILKRNELAKKKVETKFRNQKMIQKHFSDDCFEVFTVSSNEFLKRKYLQPDGTEIPKLQKVLRDLNDHNSETSNYVSGAYGILCWIQWCNDREEVDTKTKVCEVLKKNMDQQLVKVKTTMEEANKAFEKCLIEGVEKSKLSCKVELKSFLSSKKGTGFYRTLKSVMKNGGVFKTKDGTLIDLNKMLSSHLTDSIDEEFKKTFPNNRECELFNGVIGMISLVMDELIQKYKDVKLLLDFLKTEEENMKTKLISIIQNRKKTIYSSLTDTIQMDMKACYDRAAELKGKGSLQEMMDAIVGHVKDVMFDHAKNVMLNELKQLKEDIPKTLKTTMEASLKTDDSSLPDVSTELEKVEKIYKDLMAQKKRSS